MQLKSSSLVTEVMLSTELQLESALEVMTRLSPDMSASLTLMPVFPGAVGLGSRVGTVFSILVLVGLHGVGEPANFGG